MAGLIKYEYLRKNKLLHECLCVFMLSNYPRMLTLTTTTVSSNSVKSSDYSEIVDPTASSDISLTIWGTPVF